MGDHVEWMALPFWGMSDVRGVSLWRAFLALSQPFPTPLFLVFGGRPWPFPAPLGTPNGAPFGGVGGLPRPFPPGPPPPGPPPPGPTVPRPALALPFSLLTLEGAPQMAPSGPVS